jgi:uncharacterized protein YjiS (DUF1127 family)
VGNAADRKDARRTRAWSIKEEKMPAAPSKNEPDALDATGPHAWYTALTFLRTHLGRSAGAFAAELRARRAINHLRSLDDDRLWDLGMKREDVEHFVRFGRD